MTRRYTRRLGLSQIGRSNPSPPQQGPTITSVSQSAGKAAGGDVITVTGTALTGATSALGSISANTGTSLHITTNAHAAGGFSWTVTVGALSAGSQTFTYLAAPVVASVSPTHGPATVSNTSRTITCSGLPPVGSGATLTATVGGNSVTAIVNNGDGTFTCTIPIHAAGATNIVVTVDGVTSTGGTGLYTFDAVPTFTSAQWVDSTGGNTFIIGTGFLSGMAVSVNINGTPTSLTSVSVTSSTFATAILAAGSYTTGSWDITITNTDTQSVTGVAGFTVFAPSAVAGLVYDFDANTGVTSSGGAPTNGSPIDSWVSNEANAYTATASGAARPTYHTSVQNGYPSIDGDGSANWMLTGNITWTSNAATVFVVAKVVASTNGAVLFEQTNNSYNTAAANGFGVRYLASTVPQLSIYNGTVGGTVTLNESPASIGTLANSVYRVYVFTFDRAKTYPITIIANNPVANDMYMAGAHLGEGYSAGQTSATNWDTAPLSLFARNVSAAASVPSKVSILRTFAYKSALTFEQRRNISAVLESHYNTSVTPFTGTMVVLGDSISSSFDTSTGAMSWTAYIASIGYWDNRQMDVLAVGGWTYNNIYTSRANWVGILRPDVPNDVVVWAGPNDFGAGDTIKPGDIWATYTQPLLSYLHGQALVRNLFVCTMMPRGLGMGGTAASLEARREGLDTSGNVLAGFAAIAYSSATPSWILVNDGSGNPTLFRCTTSGTGSGSPSWNFTVGATTAAGGTTVFTCYGRPFNHYLRDAALLAANNATCIDLGDPATLLGTFSTTANSTYYLAADQTHLTQFSHTSIVVPAMAAYFKQNASSSIPYAAASMTSVSPSVGYRGGGIALTVAGVNFGEPAASHSLTLGGTDCTSIVRVSDLQLTATSPGTTRGVKTLLWTRIDGGTTSTTYTAVDARFDSVVPSAGSIDGGAGPYVINGAGFNNGVSTVTFGGIAQTFSTTSDAILTITTLAAGSVVSGASGDNIVITMTSGDVITGTGKWFWLPAGISRHVRGDYGLTTAAWSDFSGHSRDYVQATGARQGTVVTSDAKLGINALKFTVAGDTVYTTGGTGGGGYTFGTTNSSVVVVGRFWNGQPTGTCTIIQNPAAAAAIHWEASNAWAFYNGNFVANNFGSIGITNSPHMTICINGATSGDFYLDGANSHNASTPSASFGSPALGSAVGVTTRNSGTGFPSCDFIYAEVIEFNAKALSAGEITTMNNYRTWMYGF